jgi:hypothetical protein
VEDLPIGKGKRLLPNVYGVADKVISGWGLNGLATWQDGFPLGITATPNLTGFNTGLRANIVPGCNPNLSGTISNRLNQYFNKTCFTVPGAFTFGNTSRTMPNLRGPGTNNWNATIYKRFPIRERFVLQFRAEAFNLFNTPNFGPPNVQASTAAGNTFGVISSQINNPRLIQLALKLSY